MLNDKSYSVNHCYNEESNVLVRTILGVVNVSDIIEGWKEDIKSGIVHAGLKAVVTNFTKGENNASMADLKYLENFYAENKAIFQSVKMAVVINTKIVSVSLLYEKNNPDAIHYSFASVEAAIQWAKE